MSEVLAIERECFPHSPWEEEDFRRYKCLLAIWNGSIAAFLVSRETFAGKNGSSPEREILNVAVKHAYRRRGIGLALLARELEQDADFYLEVRESNVAAQQLYRRLGFRKITTRDAYYSGPIESAFVMYRAATSKPALTGTANISD